MPKISYIKNSSTVNAAIEHKIAISSDNVTWDFLTKDNLTVGGIYSATPGLGYPFNTKTIVVLKYPEITYTFEAQEVLNQTTWDDGTVASLKIAKEDIMSW